MRVVLVQKDGTRIVICMRHNFLMQRRGKSRYLYCEVCAEGSYKLRKKCPEWFPLSKATVDHFDGSRKRVWTWDWHPGVPGRQDYWVRKLTPKQKEFYMTRREQQKIKAEDAAKTSFVCRSCCIAAENGLHGKKNHEDAGCTGCDCQHREPR